MSTDNFQLDQLVHINSEGIDGIIYPLPPYDESVKVSDTEGEIGEIQVMKHTEDGLYDGGLTWTPDELESRE